MAVTARWWPAIKAGAGANGDRPEGSGIDMAANSPFAFPLMPWSK